MNLIFLASVLTVGPSGSSFTDIQSAVNAAVEGDTILVRPGTYAGFDAGGKSLSVTGDPQGGVSLNGPVHVHDLAAGQRFLLSGLSISLQNAPALRATNVAGSLRAHSLVLQCGYAPTLGCGVQLTGCADAALLGCSASGGMSAHQGTAGAGLLAEGSNVAVYDCTLTGGPGYAGYHMGTGGSSIGPSEGGAGCWATGTSVVFLPGCTVQGGTGGPGVVGRCFPAPIAGGTGATGGSGLIVEPNAQAHVLDSLLQGGAGGLGGAAATSCGAAAGSNGASGPTTTGSANTLPGTRRKLVSPHSEHESTSFPITIEGQPGDTAWLSIGLGTAWQLALPFQGVKLFGSPTRRALLGVVPASGTLATSLSFGDLGTGIDARTFHLQLVIQDAGGALHFGSGAGLVLLDQAF